ncbi:YegS/Rv2252/BmrU family lipid kinase [Ravibacter arvi]|uniref:YegS/Rv2252/BmrU family lipid kinase n=1 Tax=Ravibacter arvi TaxID=2051041 RepID=A0ABP8M7E7_9BACT
MALPYLFIVNPKSGDSAGKNLSHLTDFLENRMRALGHVAQVVITEAKNHATEITRTAVNSSNWRAIVAVGGDGTINEVASALLHTPVPLGIIPSGSGNGLARHLQIPMHPEGAIKRLTEGTEVRIDSARINDIPFFCTSGIGFDAAVAHHFASSLDRGFKTYIRYSLDTYKKYLPVNVAFTGENLPTFLLTFANAGQFGNNAWIAPKASVTDGSLDLCHIRPFPDWYAMVLGARLFSKSLGQSQYATYSTFRDLTVHTDQLPVLAHADGEPVTIDTTRIQVRCLPKSLSVVC